MAHVPIAVPSGMDFANTPTEAGTRDPSPRPTLRQKPWPWPRACVGNISAKAGSRLAELPQFADQCNFFVQGKASRVTEVSQWPFSFQQSEERARAEGGDWSKKAVVVTTKSLAQEIGLRRMRACTSVGATGRRMASGTPIGLW